MVAAIRVGLDEHAMKKPPARPPDHRTYPRTTAAPQRVAAPALRPGAGAGAAHRVAAPRVPLWTRHVPPERSFPRS